MSDTMSAEDVEVTGDATDDAAAESSDSAVDDGTSEPVDQLLTISQVANLSGCRYQMIYNYVQTGMIPSVFVEGERTPRVFRSVAVAWYTKYSKNKTEREEARRQRLQAQLNGES